MLVILLAMIFYFNAFPQDGLVKSFYPNGNVESEIYFKDRVREGEAKFYYENGNIKEERNYLNGRVDGLVKIYSASGKLKEVFVIEDGKREGPANLFDENGNYLTDLSYEAGKLVVQPITENYFASSNGQSEYNTAKVKIENVDISPPKESEDLLPPPQVEEVRLENDSAFLSIIEILPEPVGGMEAIYKKLIYPTEARNNEITGTVKVQAVVDEYGEVMDAQVVEGIGFGCDDVARNAIYYAKFKPGLQKGKPVKSMVIIAIEFKPEIDKSK